LIDEQVQPEQVNDARIILNFPANSRRRFRRRACWNTNSGRT
jgi:hypothetical protein